MNIEDSGIPKKAKQILIDNGITTMETLCQFSLTELKELDGIGAVALAAIAEHREDFMLVAKSEQDASQGPVGGKNKFMLEEPPEDQRTVDGEDFTVKLKFRHAQWVKDTAEMYNTTPEHIIEQSIREAYAHDPYKAGRTAESSTVLKHDNPHAGG